MFIFKIPPVAVVFVALGFVKRTLATDGLLGYGDYGHVGRGYGFHGSRGAESVYRRPRFPASVQLGLSGLNGFLPSRWIGGGLHANPMVPTADYVDEAYYSDATLPTADYVDGPYYGSEYSDGAVYSDDAMFRSARFDSDPYDFEEREEYGDGSYISDQPAADYGDGSYYSDHPDGSYYPDQLAAKYGDGSYYPDHPGAEFGDGSYFPDQPAAEYGDGSYYSDQLAAEYSDGSYYSDQPAPGYAGGSYYSDEPAGEYVSAPDLVHDSYRRGKPMLQTGPGHPSRRVGLQAPAGEVVVEHTIFGEPELIAEPYVESGYNYVPIQHEVVQYN